jgi:hypothetical protein
MARSTLTPLDRQVIRVRRRLVVQRLLDRLTWAWSGGLLLAIAWFLVQPHLVSSPPDWLRWAVLAGALGGATLATVVLSLVQAPSRVAAALALDEQFQLRERVTTALTLEPEAVVSPAGQALLDDAGRRVAGLRIGDRFPVRLRRGAWLVPAAAVALLLLTLFYHPLGPVQADSPELLTQTHAIKEEIDKQLSQLLKKPERKGTKVPRSRDLEKMEAELDRLARQPHETREQARQVVKEMTQAEDLLRKQEKEQAQRADALKAQMKQMARMENKREKKQAKDGPAKGLEQAMDKGDLQKAKQEMDKLGKQLQAEQEADRLRKKMKEPQLSEEEKKEMKEQVDRLKKQELTAKQKEELQKQMEDVKEQVQRLTRSQEAEERLRDLQRQGAINKEELERELDQLKKNSEQMDEQTRKQLEQLAQKLGECQQCMKEGKDGDAAQKLKEAAEMMEKLDPNGEGKELAQKLQQLQQAREGMCRILDGKPNPASGRRPESKEGKTGSKEEWSHSQLDKGQMQVIDTAPGDGFKGPRKPADIAEEVRQGAQEAPEAIDSQRLPRSASNMARGYFEKLRGEGPAAAPKK